MRKNVLTKEEFDRGVKDHELEILLDNGVYRHVRARKPGTGILGFDIVTYPDHLVFSGDTGSFVFCRTHDMFEFFGDDRINPEYWSEKLEAVDRCNGHQAYDPEKARKMLLEDLEEFFAEQNGYPEEGDGTEDDELAFGALAREEGRKALEEEVLYHVDTESDLRSAMENFVINEDKIFHDVWEYDFTTWSNRYLGCCWSIVWAIARYDAMKGKAGAK